MTGKATVLTNDAGANSYCPNYSELIAPAVRALQEVDKTVQDQNRVIEGQQEKIEALESENALMKAELCERDKTYSFCGATKG